MTPVDPPIDPAYEAAAKLLHAALGDAVGRIRVPDALVLAGLGGGDLRAMRLVARVMRALGWERVRSRINGAAVYVYTRGDSITRGAVLDVELGEDGPRVVARRSS